MVMAKLGKGGRYSTSCGGVCTKHLRTFTGLSNRKPIWGTGKKTPDIKLSLIFFKYAVMEMQVEW
jgi:hypothetical protein